MIILYIPFEKKDQGDLYDQAETWRKNHILHSSESLVTLHYKEEFDDEFFKEKVTVYILAHGADTDPNILANINDPRVASIIDIDNLAARFNHDLLLISPIIADIHVYCCGQQQKNQAIAKMFHQARVDKEHGDINFYGGTIYPVDPTGKKWSKTSKGMEEAQPTRLHADVEEDKEKETRGFVKTETVHDRARFLENSIHRFLTNGHSKKTALISTRRSLDADVKETPPASPEEQQSSHKKVSSRFKSEKMSHREKRRFGFTMQNRLRSDMDVEDNNNRPTISFV